MAKFFELSEENQNLIDEKFQETGLYNYIDLKVLGITKSNDVIKVAKTNPLAEKLGNCPDSIVCIVYEDAFDRMDKDQQEMLVEDAFAQVAYDSDKDKIVVGCPTINVTVGGRQKYGDTLLNAYEASLYAIMQIEEEKKAAKEAEKAAKAAKKNNN